MIKVVSPLTSLFSIEQYITTDKINAYDFKCKKCDVIFKDHIDGGHLPRCLKCDPILSGFSICEKEICDYVKSLCGEENIIENDRTILSGLELDIYIPSKNIAIEYDGLYWHSEYEGGKNKNYHVGKTNDCESKGIKLIHIFEDEWVYRKDVVKSKLKHLLSENNEKSIYARNCEIKEIVDVKEFLDKNHVQGNCQSSIKIGAFFKDELVAVMTFGKTRVIIGGNKNHKNGEYELLRFATNKKVVGVASRLLMFFEKSHKPIKIVTYADRRYSVGNLYDKIGFTKKNSGTPNYWYFKIGDNHRKHRFQFAKHRLKKSLENFVESLTEWENMKNHGFDRIWDCGNIKYEKVYV